MICVAENINIMSKTIGPAIKERNAKPIQELAVQEAEQGADYLDLNIGPARKGGNETMEWVVKTVQEVVDLPCSLDTTNVEAMEAGLKVHKGKAIINSVSLQPDRLEKGLPLAKMYEANVIALLWGEEGMPRDENERAMHMVDFFQKASDLGIPASDIWVDPIVSPLSVEINQVKACVTFMSMLKDISPEAKSIVGLSNISNGTPDELRHWLNKTYMIMLMKYGLYSAIVDAFDKELLEIAKGGKKNIAELIHKIMDGESVDMGSLSEEEVKYVKTTRVLMGQSLYSHSWLEI